MAFDKGLRAELEERPNDYIYIDLLKRPLEDENRVVRKDGTFRDFNMYLWYPAFGISWYSAAGTHAALYLAAGYS